MQTCRTFKANPHKCCAYLLNLTIIIITTFMENAICQRIMDFLSVSKLSINALSRTIGMTQSTVLRQLKGEQALSSKLLDGILSCYPDLSAEWLMRGKGDMFLQEGTKESDGTDVWKAKYEAIKDCYDSLLKSLAEVKIRELK